MGFHLKDVQLKDTQALPNGAATIQSDAIDLGHGSRGDLLANCELKLSAPALNTTQAPDTRTLTYSILHSDSADLSDSPTVLAASVIVQTGAGGAGAAAATFQMRLPVDVKRYVGFKAVGGASLGDCSGVVGTAELLF